MKKGILIFSILVLAVGTLLITVSLLSAPPKNIVTDPNNPKFNPMEFRLENYVHTFDAIPVLVKMFPVGVAREYVDSILVGVSGAKAVEVFPKTVVYYFNRPFRLELKVIDLSGRCKKGWVYEITYDHENKLEKRRVPCL
jgi:hypothetical protein